LIKEKREKSGSKSKIDKSSEPTSTESDSANLNKKGKKNEKSSQKYSIAVTGIEKSPEIEDVTKFMITEIGCEYVENKGFNEFDILLAKHFGRTAKMLIAINMGAENP